jgi:hypothetical protein
MRNNTLARGSFSFCFKRTVEWTRPLHFVFFQLNYAKQQSSAADSRHVAQICDSVCRVSSGTDNRLVLHNLVDLITPAVRLRRPFCVPSQAVELYSCG